jgi:cytochrome c biogenesis protein CcdA
MKKIIFMLALLLLLGGVFVSAENVSETNVSYFYSAGCSHCAAVSGSGILEEVNSWENVTVEKFGVSSSQASRDKYTFFVDGFGFEGGGVPFLVIERGGEYSYLRGDTPIIETLEDSIINFEAMPFNLDSDNKITLTWGSVILAAIIDSINPCAFGVLIFLMASLLKMGSSRRALRAGLLYSLVVFIVYFLVGILLYKVIDSIASTPYFYYFYLGISIFIFLLGLLQLKDVFWYGKGLTLRISSKAKPIIEKFMARGTIFSIIILGVIVSLFELPCTGEIYIGILSLMSIHKTFGISYLIVYNLIFILPLVVLTYLVYRGTSTKKLQNWTTSNRKYMKLISGLLLVGLGIYIFIRAIGFV